jgi:fatty acid desaturase
MRTVRRSIVIGRGLIVALNLACLGSLFWQPTGVLALAADVVLRAYLMFLGTVMAHEATHGHMGATRAVNFWWGRLALVPAGVPYTNFRKTHNLHHAHTNDPELDPDHFARPRRPWEIPLRALLMPHQWFFWLRARGRAGRAHVTDLLLNYAGLAAVYGAIAAVVGPARVLAALLPAQLLVSVLLWYPFAIRTHEGWSQGAPETRSHDYYGRFLYWFSLGLSLHRVHHLRPQLTWLELRTHVRSAPGGRTWLTLARDVRAA